MSFFEKVMPTRNAASPKKSTLIADLDEIIAEVYVVKVLGEEHELKPVIGLQLRDLDNAQQKVKVIGDQLLCGQNVPLDEMMEAYFNFCRLVMPSLKFESFFEMTSKQVNELLKICFRHATNQDLPKYDSDEKKNSLNQGI